ncbi:MAG: nucleotidyltransferase domain-containing protein [Actinobacteria bacterium]|nr:nucleotidyltransferase domain-containing protein [Actinomycetota bacterium]
MRFHSAFDDIWNSRVKTRLLRFLCRARSDFTGRQLAGIVGYSHTHTMAALDDLEAYGLVNRRYAGKAHLFSLNMDNVIVSRVLVPAFEVESGLINDLADRFYDGIGKKLISVTLFGSVARGEEEVGSDVDLLLVVGDGVDLDELEYKVSEISIGAAQEFGCSIMPIVVTWSEYERKLKRKQGFWKDIPKEGQLIRRVRERESVG